MQLEARGLRFAYPKSRPLFEKLSFSIGQGERVGLLGPSGRGKTTLAKLLAGYEAPGGGAVALDRAPIPKRGFCPVQLIWQHPETAVNPRWRMRQVLEEGGIPWGETAPELGIEEGWLDRYPRELSGGELQRFCIARALGGGVRFLIADEITTMLDGVAQAQLWQFLLREVRARNLGLLVITHNPHLAQQVCTRLVDFEELLK